MEKHIITGKEDHLLEDVLKIYQKNRAYFSSCGTEEITREVVENDLESLPPGVGSEKKQFSLFIEQAVPIAVVDLIKGFPDDESFYLGLLLVDGEKHGQGYGSIIYASIEEEMKADGCKRGQLGVLEKNTKSILFWEKMGYRNKKKVSSSVGQEKNCAIYVMEKSLE